MTSHRNLFSLLLLSCVSAFGQAPATDSRNTEIADTDTHFTRFDIKSRAEWETRKAHLRKQILFAAGLDPMPEKTPLNTHIFGRIEQEGYSIEKVYIETFPGYFLGGNLFRPLHGAVRHPGVLVAHGHWRYGRIENQPEFSGPVLGANLARQGYVAFAYDMTGYNDTMQTPHIFGSPEQDLWSFTPMGLQLWNSIRALDFLQTLPDVDGSRIGMTGASGGGTQTFLLTAVDDRVTVSAPVNMISAEMQGGDYCENAPGLRLGTFNVEIAALAAPRPLLLVSTIGDWTHNVPNFEYPSIRKVFALYDRESYAANAHFNFPYHNFNSDSRTAVYRFFQKHLSADGGTSEIKEHEETPPYLQEMLVFQGRALPSGALTYPEVYEAWKRRERASLEALNADGLREVLLRALAAEWPEKVNSSGEGDSLVLSRAGSGDRIPARWYPGKGAPVLLVHPEGSKSAAESEEFRALRAAGHAILCIDAFQTGAAKSPHGERAKFYLTFHRSDDQNRVQDILTALVYLKDKSSATPEVIGSGNAAIWALFAAAVSPTEVRFNPANLNFRGTDAEFLREFPVPGIQRAGGLSTALVLLNR